MTEHELSKSMILTGIHCKKRLYLEIHNSPVTDKSSITQAIRDITRLHAVKAARSLFPRGTLIEHLDDEARALLDTKRLMDACVEGVFFEPAFKTGSVFVRADILVASAGKYKLIEVKSATFVKEYHILDCAIQAWVIEKAGYSLDAMEIAYINNDFVYEGDGDYTGLFHFKEVTSRVRSVIETIPGHIARLTDTCSGNVPERKTGSHCDHPYECRFIGLCSKGDSEYPVTILANDARLLDKLIDRGYKDLREVPASLLTKQYHLMIHRATLTGIPEIHPYLGLRLSRYGYPRFFLDFEATQFAVPIWKGTRVFEQLLVQWSCHRIDSDRRIGHTDFLDTSGSLPMEKAAESLIGTLGDDGPVFVYSPFEKSVINKLIVGYPRLSHKLRPLLRRIVDILPLMRKYYYHREMKGSWSIKRVLPTIAPDLSYENLSEIRNGLGVQLAYQEAISPETEVPRREALAMKLKEYCKLDTYALVRIVDFFEQEAKKSGTEMVS